MENCLLESSDLATYIPRENMKIFYNDASLRVSLAYKLVQGVA